MLQFMGSQSQTELSDISELNCYNNISNVTAYHLKTMSFCPTSTCSLLSEMVAFSASRFLRIHIFFSPGPFACMGSVNH